MKKPKNYRFTSLEVAKVTGTSESYVKKVRAGAYIFKKTPMVVRILLADHLLAKECEKLLKEIKSKFRS